MSNELMNIAKQLAALRKRVARAETMEFGTSASLRAAGFALTSDIPTAAYPKSAAIMGDEMLCTTALTKFTTSASAYGYSIGQTSAALGDIFTGGCVLAAGTYTMSHLGATRNNRGLCTYYIDGVSQGTIDWYTVSATEVFNVTKTLSVTVLTSGYHKIEIVISKNPSSSGYTVSSTKIWFVPSSY